MKSINWDENRDRSVKENKGIRLISPLRNRTLQEIFLSINDVKCIDNQKNTGVEKHGLF